MEKVKTREPTCGEPCRQNLATLISHHSTSEYTTPPKRSAAPVNRTDLNVLDLVRLLEQAVFGVDGDVVRSGISNGDGYPRLGLGTVSPASEGGESL